MYHRNPLLNLLVWVFTFGGVFGKRFKHSNNLLTNTQSQIIDAVADREKLKTEIEQVKLSLQNAKQDQQLQLNKERAHWELQLQSEKAKIQLEREQSASREAFAIENITKRTQLKADEELVMKKLDFEQRIKQLEVDKQREILVIKEEYAKKETALHTDLHDQMYKKLNAALIQMNQEGDKNTKFVQDIMMKIFDRAPTLNTFETVNKNYTGALPSARTAVEVEVEK